MADAVRRTHGVEVDAAGRPLAFHLGILRLVTLLGASVRLPGDIDPIDEQLRRQGWIDPTSWHTVVQLQETFFMADLALARFAEAEHIIFRDKDLLEDGVAIEVIGPYFRAVEDFPLYLDALLHHLKVNLDLVATASYFLHGPAKGQLRRFPSFRSLVAWSQRHPDKVDRELVALLRDGTGWTQHLTTWDDRDPGAGLREQRTHRGARYQLGSGPGGVSVGLVRFDLPGFVAEDVVRTVSDYLHGYFGFLDQFVAYWCSRLSDHPRVAAWMAAGGNSTFAEHSETSSLARFAHAAYPRFVVP